MIAAQQVSSLNFSERAARQMKTATSIHGEFGEIAETRQEKTAEKTAEKTRAGVAEKPSDHALLHATRAGDEAAFEELVNRYRNQITNFLFRMLADYDEAVDLAQETFVRVFNARERYHDNYAFSTYIYRIAANLAISELRRRKRRRLVSLNFLLGGDGGGETEIEFQPRDEKPLPDAVFADNQTREIVQRAIQTLPEKYRAPLVLRDVAGKTYEEIAGILETNEGTIKSRISRGRSLLREKLKKYF